MEIFIKEAKPRDLPSILKINHSVQYPKKTDGFLIQKRKDEDFKKLFKIYRYFFVAEVEGQIAGYLIVLDETADYLENAIFSFYPRRYKNFVFVDQIAVLPDYQLKGVGKALYKKLMEIEKKRILLDIMIKPRNKQSISFHESLGFNFIGATIHLKNGMEARVYEYLKLYKEEILYKNSRIKILTDKKELIKEAFNELIKQRTLIENYIKKDIFFLSALKPYKIKKYAPKIVKLMAIGAETANVGPMAAVAGTIAEFTAKKMIKKGADVTVVENGGDIFAITNKEIIIGLFSGQNKVAEKLAFKLNKNNTPIAICSSSSVLGHSLSFGKCDLATVFSKKSYIADALATAVGNKVKKIEDIEKTLNWAIALKDVEGIIIIKDSKVGMIGNIPRLLLSKDEKLRQKVTKDVIYEF